MKNKKEMRQLKITQSVTTRTRMVDDYLKDISKIQRITPEEEIELAGRIQAGDMEACNRLVEANLRFVVSVAKYYQNRGLDLSDLINEGNLGLLKAAQRFDPTRGFKFISFAVWWIRQQILQSLSDASRIVRLPLNRVGLINRMSKARREFLQDHEREPSDAELAELVDIDPEKISDALLNDPKSLSLDFPLGEDGTETLIDILPDTEGPRADGTTDNESLRSDIESVLDILNERERHVLRLSFGIGCPEMSLEDIGETLSLTRERVRQVKMKAIHKLSSPMVRSRLAQYL